LATHTNSALYLSDLFLFGLSPFPKCIRTTCLVVWVSAKIPTNTSQHNRHYERTKASANDNATMHSKLNILIMMHGILHVMIAVNKRMLSKTNKN